MRMKVWGEISGERHLVGTLETIPGREEQFVYADSYLENETAQPLSVLLPLREEARIRNSMVMFSTVSMMERQIFRKGVRLPLWRKRWR